MLSGFQSKGDGHLGQNKIAKHLIELLHDNVQPAHSAQYRAGLKTKKLEKAEIDNILALKVIKPTELSGSHS